MINEKMPFVSFVTVPSGIVPEHPSYTTPVQPIGVICYKNSVTEDQAYTVVKAIHEGKKYQEAAFPSLKGFDIPAMTMKISKTPLHLGAIRYYREIGVDIPDRLMPPEAK